MATTIMSTGQITLVDLTDERISSFYLQANQSKIQVYDTNTKTYDPNYENANLIIEPFFFFGNEDYSSGLNSTNVSYTINGKAISGVAGVSQSGSKLTISKNINTEGATTPFNSNTLRVVATIKAQGITDNKTGLPNAQAIVADIEFAKVSTGLQGVDGTPGGAGADAVFAIVESTSGKVVFTDSDSDNITLRAKLYVGGAIQDKVTYTWSSIPSGISGTGATLEVPRDKVPSARSFICTITYNGQTYQDSIALTDKTDTIYCVVKSSNGDKFTNGVINTRLTCQVFNSTGEIDTSASKYVYTWEKYVDGALETSWGSNGKKTGKYIDITSDDVEGKATFTVTLTEQS